MPFNAVRYDLLISRFMIVYIFHVGLMVTIQLSQQSYHWFLDHQQSNVTLFLIYTCKFQLF